MSLQQGWAIYLRVSSEDRQTPERSFRLQRDAIDELLLNTSTLPVLATYKDRVSGTTLNRPSFQRMLSDARAGKFSHLAFYRVDRFGRDAAEALTTAKELRDLGIHLVPASNPTLDITNPDGWMLFTILCGLGEHEVGILSLRTKGGIRAKLESGHITWRAPDGYRNVQRQINTGKTESWVEKDPKRVPVIRLAFDLLLTGEYTLKTICQELDARGYLRRNGKRWYRVGKHDKEIYAKTHLRSILGNPLYAGWIVSETVGIQWGEVRAEAGAIVTEEEWFTAQEIIEQHNRRKMKTNYFYLLQGLIWLDLGFEKVTMQCARVKGEHDYYFVPKDKTALESGIYLRTEDVDVQLPEVLKHVRVDPQRLPRLSELYARNITQAVEDAKAKRVQDLRRHLTQSREQEKAYARLWAQGRLSDEAYDELVAEAHRTQSKVHHLLTAIKQDTQTRINDLDQAARILAYLPQAYAQMPNKKRQRLVRLLFKQIVVGAKGDITDIELHKPFAYLLALDHETSNTGDSQVRRSRWDKLGTPGHSSLELLTITDFEQRKLLYSVSPKT